MRINFLLPALLAATLALPVAPAHASQDTAQAAISQADLTKLIDYGNGYLEHKNELTSVLAEELEKAIQSDGFSAAPESTRYSALHLAGKLAYQAGDLKNSYRLLVQASESSLADADVWHDRLATAFDMKNYRDSALCVATIARKWPDSLERINDHAIYAIDGNLAYKGNDADYKLNLLQALFDANWSDQDSVDFHLWRELALILLDHGEIQRATDVVARIHSARYAISMLIDKRFDPITQHHPDDFDVDKISDIELAAARARVVAAPKNLLAVADLVDLLNDRCQFADAIALADSVIAKTRDTEGTSLYEDFDVQINWLLDRRARALALMGNIDDAVVQWSQAARQPEDGQLNVSQIINLADFYNSLKRSKDAADMVAQLGPMSAFGRMQLEGVKLGTAQLLNDKPAVAYHLAYLREHRDDAIGTWQYALLDSGDIDGAGAVLVERLQKPEWRNDALTELQDYADVAQTPRSVEYAAAMAKLMARPDVVAAVAKFGRIRKFKLRPAES